MLLVQCPQLPRENLCLCQHRRQQISLNLKQISVKCLNNSLNTRIMHGSRPSAKYDVFFVQVLGWKKSSSWEIFEGIQVKQKNERKYIVYLWKIE